MNPGGMQGDNLKALQALTLASAVAMWLPIGIQFIGEESVYAFFLAHMMNSGDAFHAFYRPPLFLWAAWGVRELLGDVSPEIPIRVVSILSSWLGAGVAAIFARHVFGDVRSAWLAALVFLSLGEIQFWYGWLGYADAMFHCFVFASMASAWMAVTKSSWRWLALGVLMTNAAFMTKSLIAYAFFLTTLGLAAWMHKNVRFLIRPSSLVILPVMLFGPWLWEYVHGGGGRATAGLLHDVAMRFQSFDVVAWVAHGVGVLVQFVLRMAPVAIVVAWFVIERRQPLFAGLSGRMLGVLALNLLPFVLAPQSGMRHVVPLYGWAALILTCWVRRFDPVFTRRFTGLLLVALMLKVPYSYAGLPYLKQWGTGHDFHLVAQELARETGCRGTFRLADDSFVGFSVAMYYQRTCGLHQPIRFYRQGENGVYIFSYSPKPEMRTIRKFELFGGVRYFGVVRRKVEDAS